MDRTRITFAVVRNGAVWKCHDHLEAALLHAANVAANTEHHHSYQGYDDDGKSAVVSRPVKVTVERLVNNQTAGIEARWIAGERVPFGEPRFCECTCHLDPKITHLTPCCANAGQQRKLGETIPK